MVRVRRPAPKKGAGGSASSGLGAASAGVGMVGAKKLTAVQIALVARNAGFGQSSGGYPRVVDDNSPELVRAVAIALAESGGRVNATNRNTNGSIDRGLWQINSVHAQFDAQRLLTDPLYNAEAAYSVYKERQGRAGVSGHHGFQAWTAYRSGAYLAHMQTAARAVKNMGSLDQGGLGGNRASDVDLPNVLGEGGWIDKLWPVLLQASLAGTGLALIGFALAKMFTAGTAKTVKQAAPTVAAVGKAVT